MNDDKKFQLIENYLDGSLEGKALENFEKDLAQNPALKKEVDFHRDVESMLAHAPEDDLRANLDKLNEKYSKPSNNLGKWIPYLIGLIVLVGVSWWLMQPDQEISSNPTIKTSEESTQPETTQEESPEVSVTPQEEQPKEEIQESVPTTTPEKEPKTEIPQPKKETKPAPPKKKEPRPIAGNFEANAYLESRLGSLRSDELVLEEPNQNITLKIVDGSAIFNLKGIFKTDEGMDDREINVYIFSNKMKDYEDFNPVFSKTLTFEEGEEGFNFNLSETIELGEGLYYFQIEDDMGDVFYIGKFMSKK